MRTPTAEHDNRTLYASSGADAQSKMTADDSFNIHVCVPVLPSPLH